MKGLFILMLILILCYKSADAQTAYDFKLKDDKGKYVRLSDFKGKVVVMDFWFTGCINCMNFYRTSLSTAEQRYKGNTEVVFVSICIDTDQAMWQASIAKERYTSKAAVNLYTGGQGAQHLVIKTYQVESYPQLLVIDKNGKIISRSEHLTDLNELTATIDKALKN